MTDKTICRTDGRCEYAIKSGAEGSGHCPAGKCAMPCDNSAAHLAIPGALEWDGDNGTHGVVGTHSADGESALLTEAGEHVEEHLSKQIDILTINLNSARAQLAERDALLKRSEDFVKFVHKCVRKNGEYAPLHWQEMVELDRDLSARAEPAKAKTCIECDQPYCHGVCVERGDQDYDRDQAAKGGCDE